MGYRPVGPPPRLNVDRFGLPLDFATYMWLVYREHGEDRSPRRQAFLDKDQQEGERWQRVEWR